MLNSYYRGTMSVRLFCFTAAAALLASIGTASAKDLVRLTDAQLDKVTAGAANVQLPFNTAALPNGSNGPAG